MNDELKPCPFCGVTPKMGGSGHTGHAGLDVSYAVCCENENCYARDNWIGEFFYSASLPHNSPEAQAARKAAVSAWNTRPVEDALRARIAELEAQWESVPHGVLKVRWSMRA